AGLAGTARRKRSGPSPPWAGSPWTWFRGEPTGPSNGCGAWFIGRRIGLAPLLSLVIPSRCRVDLLRRCLGSVCRHAPPATEVLVVDDASPEGAVASCVREFPSIHCLRRSRHGGFCKAANAGVRAVTGSIVELLNDDTEVTAGWAEAALA